MGLEADDGPGASELSRLCCRFEGWSAPFPGPINNVDKKLLS